MLFTDAYRDEIAQVCRQYDVASLELFGSVLGADFTSESDIDVLVRFKASGYEGAFDRLMGLKEALEHLFGRNVDIMVDGALRNRIFEQEVNETKQLIYAA